MSVIEGIAITALRGLTFTTDHGTECYVIVRRGVSGMVYAEVDHPRRKMAHVIVNDRGLHVVVPLAWQSDETRLREAVAASFQRELRFAHQAAMRTLANACASHQVKARAQATLAALVGWV